MMKSAIEATSGSRSKRCRTVEFGTKHSLIDFHSEYAILDVVKSSASSLLILFFLFFKARDHRMSRWESREEIDKNRKKALSVFFKGVLLPQHRKIVSRLSIFFFFFVDYERTIACTLSRLGKRK